LKAGSCIAFLFMLAALAGCVPNAANAPQASSDRTDLVVHRARFQDRLILTGELKAMHAERIVVPRTPVRAMPIRWMAEDGSFVSVGDKILELDNSQFSGNLGEQLLAETAALNQLMQKQADLDVEREDLEFDVERKRIALEKADIEASVPPELMARRDYQEFQLALAKSKIEQQKSIDALKTALEAGEAAIEELQIKLDKVRNEVRVAEDAIERLTIVAPSDGILVVSQFERQSRKYQIGDEVHVGLTVMQIPDLSRMKVEAKLSDVDDGKIAVGMNAVVTMDAYPERHFAARVSDITPVATQQGWQSMRRIFRATLLLEESDAETMIPGMSVRAEVLPEPIDDALLIPRVAIDFTASPPVARVAGGADAALTLGRCSALVCVVEDGVEEGVRLEVAR